MNSMHQSRKNWQWRIITWSTLFLIFGKSFGHWCYQALAIDQAYHSASAMATKMGVIEVLDQSPVALTLPTIIEVRNDTPNEYKIENTATSGKLDFQGTTFNAGETKRFIIQSLNTEQNLGTGEIIFLSAPLVGSNNTTCQEIHTLKYDFREANSTKRPLQLNLSSITSKLDCHSNALN